MRLYLYAESENKIGYLPDWIQVEYEESGKKMYLTLDIQGWIDHDRDCLSCCCKGELVPWTLCDESGNEIDLSSNYAYVEENFPDKKIAELIWNCKEELRIGLHANVGEDRFREAEADVLTDCHGRIEMWTSPENVYRREFDFIPEFASYN